MNLAEMRTRVRRDLHDEDSASYRWTDAELDRHIARAVQELSLVVPREARATLTTSAGSREISVASLSDRVMIEAVEYPTGQYPPVYVRFSLWNDVLTLLVDSTPTGGEPVNIYYGRLHTLDATSSTIPPALEDVVATGAAAYAAIEWASFATNRVNVGGPDVWRHYLTWGQERLADFASELARRGRGSQLRVRQLYRPYAPKPGQATDWGPGL